MKTVQFSLFICFLFFIHTGNSYNLIKAQSNIALEADSIHTSHVSPWEDLFAINDGYDPESSMDKTGGAYGNWDSEHNADWDWVEYYWDELKEIYQSDVYWWTDNGGILIPYDTYQLYWNIIAKSWDPLPNATGNGIAADQYNITRFDTILTNRIRVYATSTIGTGILEWKVWGKTGEQIPTGSMCVIDPGLAKGATSTITVTAKDEAGSPVQNYVFKLRMEILDNVASTDEEYTVLGTAYTVTPSILQLPGTNELGVTSFEVTIPAAIDPKDGITLHVLFNDEHTQIGNTFTIQEPGLLPPVLIADPSDNTVDNPIEIEFTDDMAWRTAITEVSIGENSLVEAVDYLIEAGKITLLPSGGNASLTVSGIKNISIRAAGYEEAHIEQTIMTGAVAPENSSASTLLNLYLHTSTKIRFTAHDQYNNPVSGYVGHFDVNIINSTSITNEQWGVAGSTVSADLYDQDFPATDEQGQAFIALKIADEVDLNDGIEIAIKLDDGTLLPEKIHYLNEGSEKEIVIQFAVENHADFSWENTAQSDNFIVYWGNRITGDPKDPANGNLSFDPNNILKIMENLLAYMTDSIGFIDNADERNMARYKHEVVMNETWTGGTFPGYAFGGWIEDGKAGGMWIHPGATGGPAILAHEFTHMCQAMIMVQYPGYGLNASYAGFFWESHANYIMAQYTQTYTGVQPERFINTSMLHFSTTRHYYQNQYFIDYISDTYGPETVNYIWRKASPVFSHPLTSLRDSVLRYTQDDLNDDFGRYAMKNITWDYQNGPLIRKAIQSVNGIYIGREYTVPDSLKDGSGAFVVPRHLAPGDYGYNIIPLFPDEGATEVSIHFTGYANEPADGAGSRYGFVAVDAAGNPRYSDVYSDLQEEASFSITPADSALFLVVTGAPKIHHNYGWSTGFPKEYRYPYSFSLQGAVPAGHKSGYNSMREDYTGAEHANGGGWVASTATVAETAYVGPHAQVLDKAVVTGDVRIEDYAIVKGNAIVGSSAVIRGTAIVGGTSQVGGNAIVEQSSRVYGTTLSHDVVVTGSAMIFNSTLRDNALAKDLAYLSNVTLSGTVIVGGDAEEWTACSSGMYLQMQTVRTTGCDGKITHRLNEDVNPDWDIYTYPIGAIPASPLNLEASEITRVSVRLDWDAAPSLNELAGYFVVQNGNVVQTLEETSTVVSDLLPGMNYAFYIRAMDYLGNISASSDTIQLSTSPSTTEPLTGNKGMEIYPNPTNTSFTIRLKEADKASVRIYDGTGRQVFTAAFREQLQISKDQIGLEGIYYIEVNTNSYRYTEKVLLY